MRFGIISALKQNVASPNCQQSIQITSKKIPGIEPQHALWINMQLNDSKKKRCSASAINKYYNDSNNRSTFHIQMDKKCSQRFQESFNRIFHHQMDNKKAKDSKNHLTESLKKNQNETVNQLQPKIQESFKRIPIRIFKNVLFFSKDADRIWATSTWTHPVYKIRVSPPTTPLPPPLPLPYNHKLPITKRSTRETFSRTCPALQL